MKNILVLIALSLLLVGCCEDKHDPQKQMTLLQQCINSHAPTGYKITDIGGGVVYYCERFAEENSRVEVCK